MEGGVDSARTQNLPMPTLRSGLMTASMRIYGKCPDAEEALTICNSGVPITSIASLG